MGLQDIDSIDPLQLRRSSHEQVIHRSESWGHIRADLVKRTGLGRQETRIATAKHTFLMNVLGVAREGEDFVDGRRISFSARPPGSIVYIPAGREWHGWDGGDQIACYLLVSIESEFPERVLGSSTRHQLSELPPSIGFRDATIEVALQTIVSELKNPDPISATMVESQAAQMFVRLLRMSGIDRRQARGGLSPFDLKRAVALLKSLAGERPSSAELASEFDVTPRHFCRAFKQSTGLTPHAFLARYRLDRSAEMLRSTDDSATDIALECGFGSSSNFAIAFRRAFAQSPTEFRRSCKT